MKQILAVDIGGQGVKLAQFSASGGEIKRVGKVDSWHPNDWNHFESELRKRFDFSGWIVGVSCAGFVDTPNGVVRLSRATDWSDYPLRKSMLAAGAKSVVVMNDAEAHLLAHHDEPLTLLNIALGTAPGIALLNEQGEIMKPSPYSNLDIGHFKLHTSSEKLAGDGLGKKAYKELLHDLGTKQGCWRYGARLGAFTAQMCNIFQPKTIVFSGGLVETNWEYIYEPLLEQVQGALPVWLKPPTLKRSRHGALAALQGIAQAASNAFHQ